MLQRWKEGGRGKGERWKEEEQGRGEDLFSHILVHLTRHRRIKVVKRSASTVFGEEEKSIVFR